MTHSIASRSWPSLLAVALGIGVVGNILVRSPEGPGLNAPLFFITVAGAIGVVTRLEERRGAGNSPSLEAWGWIAAGLTLSLGFVLRASEALQALAFLGAAAAFAFPALRAGGQWVRDSGASDYLEAIVGALGWSGLGGLRVATGVLARNEVEASDDPDDPGEGPDASGRSGRGVGAVVRGLVLAAPLVLLFGALFMAADRVFADLVASLFGTALEEWAEHLVVTGILTWLAAGYLTGFLSGTRVRGVLERGMAAYGIRRPTVGIVEVGIVLGLLALLFSAFIAVQFRYLFGGAGMVEVTPGLTYAEYAREGFGQLLVVAALVLPTLLVADWLLRTPDPRQLRVFRFLGGLQLVLLVLVIVSAFQRVRAYQEAYGLTESRFHGVVFLGWLTALSAWLGWTVLRGRRERFAFPALVSGFAVIAALFVVNPDARIALGNLERGAGVAEVEGASTSGRGAEFAGIGSLDIAYLASLSADAVPALLEALPRLSVDARCRLAARLLERWDTDADPGWRSWNLSVARARDSVRSRAPDLRLMLEAGVECLEG